MSSVKRKITYRLYLTKKQELAMWLVLCLHQQLYNAALEQRISAYRKQKKSLSYVTQARDLTLLRGEMDEYRTAKIIKNSALIAVEQLNIKAMSREGGSHKKGLNREILSAAPGLFHQMLKYKAEEAGVEWVEIPTRQVKPSQTCHVCGRQEKRLLSQRQHECDCGALCTRDENAARVILNWALVGSANGQELARCGEVALAASMKHETPSISA